MKHIFNESKYTRWYYAIIEKRRVDDSHEQSEVHHIIPRSLGGTDEPDNLVRLTYHDHAWCHWLLTKMTSGNDLAKMRYAFNMMNVGGEHMGRVLDSKIVRAYAKNREELIKLHSEFMRGREPWNKGKKLEGEQYKGGRKNRGKKHTEETKKLIGQSQIGKKMSRESSEKKRNSMIGFVRGHMSDEEKLKRSVANKGKVRSSDQKNRYSNAVSGNISINKDGVEKKVKADILQQWLDDGWLLGGRKRPSQQDKSRGPYKKTTQV